MSDETDEDARPRIPDKYERSRVPVEDPPWFPPFMDDYRRYEPLPEEVEFYG
ncbi:hypothetical protein [Saccharopolyspora sp. NPDC002686]|uniref:hypothetical protein n=1 Tax=Saccharopolyspora sp. NPDC002686 TaxID=3154541 RepID=UPI00332DA51E